MSVLLPLHTKVKVVVPGESGGAYASVVSCTTVGAEFMSSGRRRFSSSLSPGSEVILKIDTRDGEVLTARARVHECTATYLRVGYLGEPIVETRQRQSVRVEIDERVRIQWRDPHGTMRDDAARIVDLSATGAPGRLFYVPDESPQLDDLAAFIGGRIEPDPTAEATVVFVDVVGSTDHAHAMGDARWLQVLDDLDAFVERAVALNSGRVVKQMGDGHLAIFGEPVDGVAAASFIARGVTALGIQVRAGVHLGPVSFRPNGDIGGMTVHFAARICAAAQGGQVFVSDVLATHLGSGPFRFENRGERDFKGIRGRHTVHAALSN